MNQISFNLLWEVLEYEISNVYVIEVTSEYLRRILIDHPEKNHRFLEDYWQRENVNNLNFQECKEIIT